RAEGREQDELADGHAGDARRERDERTHDRHQPAEEGGRGAVFLEAAGGEPQRVRPDEQVPPPALEERPAAPGADVVADDRADRVADRGERPNTPRPPRPVSPRP